MKGLFGKVDSDLSKDQHNSIFVQGVLRKPTGLALLINQKKHSTQEIQAALTEQKYEDINWSNLYETIERPLSKDSEAFPSQYPNLLPSWAYLATCSTWKGATPFHILNVLLQTLPDPHTTTIPLPSLNLHHNLPPPKPTAAHPRAFQDTTDKPPKKRRLKPFDLRPFLCHERECQRLLTFFLDDIPQVIPKLVKKGYSQKGMSPAQPPYKKNSSRFISQGY